MLLLSCSFNYSGRNIMEDDYFEEDKEAQDPIALAYMAGIDDEI